jgi:hypothetical protein
VALIRTGDRHPDDGGPTVQYHLYNHVGGSGVVLDDQGELTNREEYYPYGQYSFGVLTRKQYRFTGKERDEESGLSCLGVRLYAPWLARASTTSAAPHPGRSTTQRLSRVAPPAERALLLLHMIDVLDGGGDNHIHEPGHSRRDSRAGHEGLQPGSSK